MRRIRGGLPFLEETHADQLTQYTRHDLDKYLKSIRQPDVHYSSSSESDSWADDDDDLDDDARGEPATTSTGGSAGPAGSSGSAGPAGSGGSTGPVEAD